MKQHRMVIEVDKDQYMRLRGKLLREHGERDFYARHSRLVSRIKEPETIGVIVHLKAPVMLGKHIMLSDTFLFDRFRSAGKGILEVMRSKIDAIAL